MKYPLPSLGAQNPVLGCFSQIGPPVLVSADASTSPQNAALEKIFIRRRATRPAYPVPSSCAQPSASTTAGSDEGAKMATSSGRQHKLTAAVPTSQGSP